MYGDLPEVKNINGDTVHGFPVVIQSSPTGPKTALLRLPASDELLSYLKTKKSIYHDLGRGKGFSEEVPTPKADQKLFHALRLDNGDGSVEFDDAEALYAIDLVTRHRVLSCERQGQNYVVTLATLFGDVVHTVRMPYHSERDEYQRRCYEPMDLPGNLEQRRFPPEVPIKLYDRIIVIATGYMGVENPISDTSKIPPHHKRSIVIAVLSALASLDPALGSDSDPNS